MDPFSIVIGSATIIDICFRLVRYLKDFQEATAKVEAEISALVHEFEALIVVNESINATFKVELGTVNGKQAAPEGHLDVLAVDSDTVHNLWRDIGRNLKDCQSVVQKLEEVVEEIVGKEIVGKARTGFVRKLDDFKKYRRKESRDREFRQLRDQVTTFQRALQMLMTAINTVYTRGTQSTADQTNRSMGELSANFQTLDVSLKSQIESMKPLIQSPDIYDLRCSVQSATAVASLNSLNKFFDIPEPVSSIFTGREALLEELQDAFTTPATPGSRHMQKRFVVYGLGGSGKTQFCCKFAQENQTSFWGIFHVDGSSDARAKQTFSRIAKLAGLESNESAAKNWLSNLKDPWLLIIDNADDSRIPLERYFPGGEMGHILVTTRNPNLKLHGTVGKRAFHFEEMRDLDATKLLLRAANTPCPWNEPTLKSAGLITKALGFLPLALVHAGKAIMNNFCTLGNYLASYNMNWQRVRIDRRFSGVTGEENVYLTVYTTYELNFEELQAKDTEASKDAVELLKLFSFFQRDNIRVDILTKAVTNQTEERNQENQSKEHDKAMRNSQYTKSWTQTFEETKTAIVAFLLTNRSPPVLPSVLRQTDSEPFDDYKLRTALKELAQMSLLTHNDANDSYSMHPLVHTWIRERPKMSTPEQAIWCQAAATTIARSILLPPLGTSEADEDLRRDILPHIEHIQSCQQIILERFSKNQKKRQRPWPVLEARFDREQALRMAKFSLVHAQCGQWNEAEKLQLQVKEFVCSMLGMKHPRAMEITLALSQTYWHLGRGNEAAELQAEVLQVCKSSLFADDLRTLRVMDILGVSRWQQGRFTEALELHSAATEGMERVLGANHEDTLKAMTHLGRVQDKFFRFDKAKSLHLMAVNGMESTLGPTHLETLSAKDNLAMTYLSIGGQCVVQAERLLIEVVNQRSKKLGKEHPYTLLALCNLARVETCLGRVKQAETRMRAGIQVAKRNLGEDHIGVLYGRTYLAQNLVEQERYEEAELMFLEIIERYKYMASTTDSEHPDRIMAMLHLMECYRRQNKNGDALNLCDEISKALIILNGQDHPLAKRLKNIRTEILESPIGRRASAHSQQSKIGVISIRSQTF